MISVITGYEGVKHRKARDCAIICRDAPTIMTILCDIPQPSQSLRMRGGGRHHDGRPAVSRLVPIDTTVRYRSLRAASGTVYYGQIKVQRSAGYVANSNTPDLRATSRIDTASQHGRY